jgi:hypothetical protein
MIHDQVASTTVCSESPQEMHFGDVLVLRGRRMSDDRRSENLRDADFMILVGDDDLTSLSLSLSLVPAHSP